MKIQNTPIRIFSYIVLALGVFFFSSLSSFHYHVHASSKPHINNILEGEYDSHIEENHAQQTCLICCLSEHRSKYLDVSKQPASPFNSVHTQSTVFINQGIKIQVPLFILAPKVSPPYLLN